MIDILYFRIPAEKQANPLYFYFTLRIHILITMTWTCERSPEKDELFIRVHNIYCTHSQLSKKSFINCVFCFAAAAKKNLRFFWSCPTLLGKYQYIIEYCWFPAQPSSALLQEIHLFVFVWCQKNINIYILTLLTSRVVDPDPAGSEIICMFGSGSGSVINFGSGSGSGSGSKCSRFPTYGTVAISIKENRF